MRNYQQRSVILVGVLTFILLVTGCGGGPSIAPGAGDVPTSVSGKIAFCTTRDGNHEIYLMDTDGSGQINLSNNPALDATPAWSPDSSRIAFRSDRDGNSEIYVMGADGTGLVNLTNTSAKESWPVWSPR